MAVIGHSFETPVAPSARVGTDQQRQRINDLHRAGALSASLKKPVPDGRFNLPRTYAKAI